ncbi:MAG: hypothetical protein ABIQ03_12285 [Burkholderiales bacterium]
MATNSDTTAKQRYDDLVLWYVNGTLDQESKAWVEEYLLVHPDAQHELAWHHELRNAVHIRNLNIPADVGLHRLLEQVKAEQAKSRDSWVKRGWNVLAGMNARPAFAMAGGLVLAQAITLGFLVKEVRDQDQLISGYSATRAAADQQELNRPALQVTFKSSATERDIRFLLIQIQGRIIDGPKQLGDFTVSVPEERFEQAKATLEKSVIVELVLLQKSRSAGE